MLRNYFLKEEANKNHKFNLSGALVCFKFIMQHMYT